MFAKSKYKDDEDKEKRATQYVVDHDKWKDDHYFPPEAQARLKVLKGENHGATPHFDAVHGPDAPRLPKTVVTEKIERDSAVKAVKQAAYNSSSGKTSTAPKKGLSIDDFD
jgi:hypothetical protein